MKLLASVRSLLSILLHRSRVEDDMEEELRSHIQHRADDLERSGFDRPEAERMARIEFGGFQRYKEESRETLGAHFLESLLRDVRYGLRTMRKSPGFTAVAILTLALGIGANSAIFSLINAVMLRLLPVERPQELVQLLRLNPARGGNGVPSFTNALWEQVRDHEDVFSSTFAWSSSQFDLAERGTVHLADGLFVSGAYFSALNVNPAAGRLLSPADDQRGCPALAVLSYGFWRERFGQSPSAIGSTLSLNKHPFQVIGVSPEGFSGLEVGRKFDVAVPVCAAAVFDEKESRLERRDWWWLEMGGRIRPGMSAQRLKARLRVLAPQVFSNAAPADWPPADQQRFSKLLLLSAPLASGTSVLRLQFGQPLTVLMAVVGSVLLIACANLASLMFARASSRRREIAVRTALGASRARLIRQLMTECLLLSLGGGLLGILLARWGAALVVRYISTGQHQIFLDLSPDFRVVGFTAAIALITGVLSGVFPALRSTRVSLTAAIQSRQGEGTEHRARIRPGKWIVASQVALSLVLVVVAGLFLRSLVKLVTLDIGFDPSHVLLVNANLKTAGVPVEQHVVVFDEIERRLRALPGVIAVGRSLRVPVTSEEWTQTAEVDSSNPPKGDDAIVYFNSISAGYFQTLRTPLLAGRDFNTSDTKSSVQVAIINETFAHKFFPDDNPIGQYFRKGRPKPGPLQIVGLVRDSKYESLREGSYSQAFLPTSQIGETQAENFEVRTGMLLSTLVPAVQNAVADVNKDVSLDFHSLEEQVGDSLVQERLLATLSAFFGSLALLLATIGLYGVLSYLVTQRQGEFGVRIALGAPAKSILRLVMQDVAVIVLGGTAGGIAISLVTVQLLQKLLFGLGARDAVTMLGAVAVLTVVALVAGYIPARRAMKVDPMVALRYE